MKTRLILALALLMPAVALADATNDAGRIPTSNYVANQAPAGVSGNINFDGSEATMSPRFFRSGVVGDVCSEFDAGDFQYQTVAFNSGTSGSVTANFDPGTCGTGIYVTFHTAPFNPANICQNYVFSEGSSIAFSETFAVPPSTPMVMVVSGVTPNAPDLVCGPATYSIDAGSQPQPYTYIPVPTMGKLALLALMVLLVGVCARILVRRSRQ